MKTAIVGLPHYKGTKRMILEQLAKMGTEYLIMDEPEILAEVAEGQKNANLTLINIERLELNYLRQGLGEFPVDQVISFSDRTLLVAAELRRDLGIQKGNSPAVELSVINKGITRRVLTRGGLNNVRYEECQLENLREASRKMSTPFVVKPIALTGSLCVELIHNEGAIDQYIERCKANKVFGASTLILEDYLNGEEFSVEGIVIDGRIEYFGICEKSNSGEPYFVETGHDFYSCHPDRAAFYSYTTKVIECLGLKDCPFHIELKAVANGFEVIEAHTRFGGHMIMELVRHALGIDPYSYYIDAQKRGVITSVAKKTNNLHSLMMLTATHGTVNHASLGSEITSDPRVISFNLDYEPGQEIESNVSPVNYLGYVSFRAQDKKDAQVFRRRVEATSVIKVITKGDVAHA